MYFHLLLLHSQGFLALDVVANKCSLILKMLYSLLQFSWH